ncbi:dihydropteroate synthase [Halobacteriales archaeon QS_8_69_26]|nr:MAG: dihydropteroate synthase [Halobacteriales archaeon QS_8_69_26]
MDYFEAMEFLAGLPHSRPKLGTDTTERMLDHLGSPHESFDALQVAGSNGKGSTARMVESVLREAGLRVGLYTSPDLADLRERIRVDGRKVTKAALSEHVAALRPHVVGRTIAGDGPTFFEVLTAVALANFADRDVDVAVLEVGIGGRYDATSAVDPVASAVTSVSLEHADLLGDTVEEIARDKAQVAPGDRPLVTGATGAALGAIREETDVVTVGGEDADVRAVEEGTTDGFESRVSLSGEDLDVETAIPLLGAHQATNAGVAALLARQVAGIDDATIERGLRGAHWPGRFEVMETEPLVVLDGAHNPAACGTLATLLDRFDYDDLHLVFGAMRDKDHDGMRAALPTPDVATVCRPAVDRAETTEVLAAAFEADGSDRVETAGSVASGVEQALTAAGADDCVLITGSLYTVSEARDRWTRPTVPAEVRSVADARDVLDRADVPPGRARRTVEGTVGRTVTVEVRPGQAETIRVETLGAGGECAVSGAGSPDGRVELVLSGTLDAFRDLVAALDADSPGLGRIADEIRGAVGLPVEGGTGSGIPRGPAGSGGGDDARGSEDDRPTLMGVLNVTPDSFHDGGEYLAVDDAVAHAERMVEEGAGIVDVGGESTRPGADPVPPDEERDRVVPVVEAIADLDAAVSVDTRKAAVADAALSAGADLVNDVTGLGDPEMRHVVADHDASVVVMHSLSVPVDPDRRDAAAYDDPVGDVIEELAERVLVAERAGIDRGNVIVDPGVGFGKEAAESFELIARIEELRSLGCRVMLGHSHKSLFDAIDCPSGERLAPTVAVTAMAAEAGVDVVRVHDVAENAAAIRAVEAAGRLG